MLDFYIIISVLLFQCVPLALAIAIIASYLVKGDKND